MARAIEKRRCAACKKPFVPNARVRNQRFCSQDSCQKERRRREQQERRRRDPDYRENERCAQERRKEKNPHYSRDFRRNNPEAAKRNRLKQRERDRRRRGREVVPGELLATEAPSAGVSPIRSGTYELTPIAKGVLATEASMTVEISLVSVTCA